MVSSILDRNSLRIFEAFAVLYPATTSMVGTSPVRGRLTTDHGRKLLAEAGSSAMPRVEATSEIAIA